MSSEPLVSDVDLFWMRRALAEAERGRGSVEPNPLVGAVIVRDGQFVASGFHERFGEAHAEVRALRSAREAARGSTLYVSLEPCCHQGKTPPCVEAIIAAGVTRVVTAMTDPFSKVAGGGHQRLKDANIEVVSCVEEQDARRLNAPYLKRMIMGRPYVTAKWAMTLDGRLATATGESRWISSERSRAAVHELRGRMDAIIIGIGTALADDPRLTARPKGPRIATRVVLDSEGRLPLESQLVRTVREIPLIIAVSGRAALEKVTALRIKECRIIEFKDSLRVPIDRLLDELGRLGMTNVLVEGGGQILGSFFDSGEIDAFDVFVAPRVLGGSPAHVPNVGRGVHTMAEALSLACPRFSLLDGDIRLQGTIERPWWHETTGKLLFL